MCSVPLAGLFDLEKVDLENCPVTDFSPLNRLPKLKLINGEKYKRPRVKK